MSGVVTERRGSQARAADDRIRDATDRLLRSRPLADIGIADIVRDAGISKASFYLSYPSKMAVVADLGKRAGDALLVTLAPLLEAESPALDQRVDRILDAIAGWWEASHGLTGAIAANWPLDDGLGVTWTSMIGELADRLARTPELQRHARPEVLAHTLAWATERVLHMSEGGAIDGLPDLTAGRSALAQVWRAALTPVPLARGRRRAPRMDPPAEAVAEEGARDAILRATTALLETRPVRELTVRDVVEKAGVSRASFYVHFTSLAGVVAALLAASTPGLLAGIDAWTAERAGPDRERLRASTEITAHVFFERRATLCAVVESLPVEPSLAELWSALVAHFAATFAALVEADPAARPLEARPVLAALAWATERVYYVAVAGQDEALADQTSITDAVAHLWTSTIYGDAQG